MTHLRNALLCLFLALLCVLTAQAIYTLERFNEASAAATSAIQETQRRVAHTSANLNAVLIQAGLAADQLRRASERQGEYSTRLIAALDETTNMVREGRKTLEVAREQIEANGKAVEKAVASIDGVARETQNRVSQSGQLIQNLTDASIPLRDVSGRLADASASAAVAASTTARGIASLASAAESVDQALKPLRTTGGKLKAILKWALGLVKINIR